MSTSICGICLCPFEEGVDCNACSSVICSECFEALMEFCLKENKMIACSNPLCEQHYQKTSVPNHLLPLYFKTTHNYLFKTHSETIEEEKSYVALVKTIREDRMKFIQAEFPTAIGIIVKIAYSKELSKVSRDNEKLKKAAASSRRCMNFVCKGKMVKEKEYWKCLVCKKKFCLRCEMLIEVGHECKEADLESVKSVQSMVKCPKCGCPAIKSQGCNNITCAVCRTNFDYITGERSTAGNHTKDDALHLKENNSLLEMYPDASAEEKKLLVCIDTKQPKLPNFTATMNALKKELSAEEVANKYSYYLLQSSKCVTYAEMLAAIEKQSRQSKLDVDFLEKVIEKLS